MIRFHLKCAENHEFESWFQSGEAFDKLVTAKMVTCATCGSTDVEKKIMAPAVSKSSAISVPKQTEAALAAMRE